jgi:hypothetical protein
MIEKSEVVRTLGLYQPFAGLMLHGKIETRLVGRYWDPINEKIVDRKPPFPLGKYLLYATKKPFDVFGVAKISGRFYDRLSTIQHGDYWKDFHLFGMAICVGDLTEIIDPISPQPATFVDLDCVVFDISNYPTHRRVGLVFKNIQRIEPFPFKGKQGIGFLSDADKSKIKFL